MQSYRFYTPMFAKKFLFYWYIAHAHFIIHTKDIYQTVKFDKENHLYVCLDMVTKQTVKILNMWEQLEIGQAGYLLNHPRRIYSGTESTIFSAE